MFISVKFLDNQLANDIYQLSFLLEDTEVTAKIHVPIEKDIYDTRGDASVIPSGLIAFYKSRNQNVAKNLALFYSTLPYNKHTAAQMARQFVAIDAMWSDIYFPEAQFSTKYTQCTLNQLDTMIYTGMFNQLQRRDA